MLALCCFPAVTIWDLVVLSFVGVAHADYSGEHQSQKLPEAWADRLVVAAKLSHGTSLWLGEVPEQRS